MFLQDGRTKAFHDLDDGENTWGRAPGRMKGQKQRQNTSENGFCFFSECINFDYRDLI